MNQKEINKFVDLLKDLEAKYYQKNDQKNVNRIRMSQKAFNLLVRYCLVSDMSPLDIIPIKKNGRIGFVAKFEGGKVKEFYE